MGSVPETGRVVFSSSERTPGRSAPWTFTRYLIWRLIAAGIIVLLGLTLIFYAVELQPGDPTRFLHHPSCATAPFACNLRDQLIRHWGLDQPVLNRYVIFLSNVLTGNLGPSTTYRPAAPIADLIVAALPTTLLLTGIGLSAVIVLGLLLGMPLSRRKGGVADSVVSLLLAVPFAITVFALGQGMLGLFGIVFPVFPLYGTQSPGYATLDPLGRFLDAAWHFVLPLLVLILAGWGLFVWIVRDHPLRPPESGISAIPGEWRVRKPTVRQRLRAALPRFLPAIPALLGWTLGSAFMVDAIFGLRGLGSLMWYATLNLDYWLLTGIVVVVSLVLVLPALVVADLIHYGLTADWVRSDGLRVESFRVEPRDLKRGFTRVLLHPLGFAGLVLAVVLLGMTVAAPLLVGPFPTAYTVAQPLLPPSPEHPLGTDSRGFDILTLTAYGGQIGIAVAIGAFAFALIAGLGVTSAVGFFGERADLFVGIPADLFLVLPLPFILLLGILQYGSVFVVFSGIVAWPIPVRILRMELARIVGKERQGRGAEPSVTERGRRALNLVWGMGPVLLGNALLAVSLALSVWSVLGLFGFRVPGTVSWGEMIADWYYSLGLVQGRWDGFIAPAVCLTTAVLAPLLLGLACKAIGPTSRAREPQLAPVPAGPSAATTLPPP